MRKGTGPRFGTYYLKHWNMALRRVVAMRVAFQADTEKMKIFDESLPLHGHVELGKRIASHGMKIILAPEAVVEHSRATSVGSFARNNLFMARTCRVLRIQHVPHLVLAGFVLAATAVVLVSWCVVPARTVLLYGDILYGSILVTEAVIGSKRTKNVLVACLIPLLLFLLHWTRGDRLSFSDA